MLAVHHRQVALAKVTDAAANGHRHGEAPHGDVSGAGEQHEYLERYRRRQQRRHDHGEQAKSLIQLEGAVDVGALQALAHEDLAAATGHGE